MTKKQWLWFWLLALLLLILVCVWGKLDTMKVESIKKEVISVKEIEKVVAPVPVVEAVKVVEPKKDLHFKIVKSDDSMTMSGVLAQKSDFDTISGAYSGLNQDELSFDSGYENSTVMKIVIGVKDIFAKFKSGFIEYGDKGLVVDGIVTSAEDKELVDSMIASIKDINAVSNIVVELPKPKVEHISKLSIVKSDDSIMISGIFSSEDEIDTLVTLLKRDGVSVKKRLCIVDSDLEGDKWKNLVSAVVSDFVNNFSKATIQFDKDKFDISGQTVKDGVKENIEQLIDENIGEFKLAKDIVYVKPTPTKEQVQAELNSILKLKHVEFVLATAELTTKGKNTLDEVLQILKKYPQESISIAGHTDSDGDKALNLKLSQDRADAIKEYLVNNGLDKNTLVARGYGESMPLVKNNSVANKQINRRVEFKIEGK